MSLYATLILATILGPLCLSFDRKIHFYTYFKPLLLSILVVGGIFVAWDEFFTQNGIWGFNTTYLTGIYLGHLPIEEISFFVVVPFACIFIYEVMKGYFPQIKKEKLSKVFALAFLTAGSILGLIYIQNWYTGSACLLAALLTYILYFKMKVKWYGDFAIAYLIALIPFIIVNGFLTGMATPEPVVWYSPEHIMGLRIITIPTEDLFYNYDMLIGVCFFYERWKAKWNL
jgi:lycopene cyclase domain-containing protein